MKPGTFRSVHLTRWRPSNSGWSRAAWLSAAEQAELLADFIPWVEVVEIPNPPLHVPPRRDPHDLPFLHLAVVGKARALVSGDRDPLALAGARGLCPVLTVDAFSRQYLGG